MNTQDLENITTVLCLFHTREHAQAALADLQKSDIPPTSISVIDGKNSSVRGAGVSSALQQLELPERDRQILSDGLNAGGSIVVVSGPESYTDAAEDVFSKHRAMQVDEKVITENTAQPLAAQPAAAVNTAADAVIPVVEEELVVGKRQVQRGGVRVYSHMVETPVEEKLTLQQERAVVERHPVNRPVSEADVAKLKDQSIEVVETEEVPVVAKSARVVEEVLVSKETTQRTEQITDTVRRTEVDVEPVVDTVETSTVKPKGRAKNS